MEGKDQPVFEFHVSRAARERYGFDDQLFSLSGNVVFANLAASREFAERMNRVRQADRHPERAVHAGALNAMGLIDEALHALMAQYRRTNPSVMAEALAWLGARLGTDAVDPNVVMIKAVVVLRGPHQPGRLLDHTAATDLRQANGARRTAEAVGGLKVDRRKVQTHDPDFTALRCSGPVLAPVQCPTAAVKYP